MGEMRRFRTFAPSGSGETDIEKMDLGNLNNFRYRPHGRLVTVDEWAALDKLSSAITSHLDTLDLKRKIHIRELGLSFWKDPFAILILVGNIDRPVYHIALFNRILTDV
jgi:hypothetical protein